MARRVYNDIDAEVLLRLANRTDITATQRNFFIRDGYLDVCAMFRHVQLQGISPAEVCAINTDNFTPVNVTDFWFPTALRNVTDGYIIRQEALERVEYLQTKPTSRPYTFHWYGGAIYFESLCEANKTIKVWYKKIPSMAPLVAGGGSIAIDELFDPLVIMRAAKIGFETTRDLDNAEKEQALFANYAKEKKLPLEQARLNDYRTGWRVRFR
jgi:hypothetical protein